MNTTTTQTESLSVSEDELNQMWERHKKLHGYTIQLKTLLSTKNELLEEAASLRIPAYFGTNGIPAGQIYVSLQIQFDVEKAQVNFPVPFQTDKKGFIQQELELREYLEKVNQWNEQYKSLIETIEQDTEVELGWSSSYLYLSKK